MKQRWIITLSLLLWIGGTGCNPAGVRVQNAARSLQYAETNYQKFGEKDWEKLGLEMAHLEENLMSDKVKFTSEQRSAANKLLGRYAALQLKNEWNKITTDIQDIGDQLEGALESLEEETK